MPAPPPSVAAHLPDQRWHVCTPDPDQVATLSAQTGLSWPLARVLVNHGLDTQEAAIAFLEPESQHLPSPLTEFTDLAPSLNLLQQTIVAGHAIAICGDYDADGMTSTALLLRSLRALGATVNYAIPSRMQEGYGINERIVEDFAAEGVRLILTVDNGIAAYDPIAHARRLGLAVILTDHHDLPPQLPPANAILNPKCLPETSPYRGLAGVGVAYVLAASLAQQMGQGQTVIPSLLELFTLGTIADLAPLIGVNRRWLKRGLKRLPNSQIPGIQALIQVSGALEGATTQQPLKPEAIGFRLGPRINAVGRIGNPQTVIELLTTDDRGQALERAMQCEQANRERQHLCTVIEQEALALIQAAAAQGDVSLSPQEQRVLVLVQPGWHHGVIGIVASRLVDRYGVPVFIGTYEDDAHIRGSARGTPEFDVFAALQFCADLLDKFGGHRAAGGFSLAAGQMEALRSRLRTFAHQHLQPEHLKPLLTLDAQLNFADITWAFYHELDRLHPCGIGNAEPLFWTSQVQVLDQKLMGKDSAHLKLTLAHTDAAHKTHRLKATAWRWGEYFPLPPHLDVAYRLRDNTWQGNTTLELEVAGARIASPLASSPETGCSSEAQHPAQPAPPTTTTPSEIDAFLVSQGDLELYCPAPTQSFANPKWHPLEQLESLLPTLQGQLLIYGHQRPYLPQTTLRVNVEYDRPRHPCDTLILWTLPPSWTHLRWLLALGQPHHVYLHHNRPTLPSLVTLRRNLKYHLVRFAPRRLNLLDLGQKWWVAPCTLVATLREMGYPCVGFPDTYTLTQELQRLETWYQLSAQQLSHLAQRS